MERAIEILSRVEPVAVDHAPPTSSIADLGKRVAFASRSSSSTYNLDDAFGWADYCVSGLSGCDLEGVLEAWGGTYSTACSGIDSPCSALHDLQCALERASPSVDVQLPQCISCVEWDGKCQDELLLLHTAHGTGCCAFSDLCEFYSADVLEYLPDLQQHPDKALDALLPVILAGKAMKPSANCLVHGRRCTLVPADKHVAGTSCTAFSPQGVQAREFDVTILAFLAWAGMRRLMQEAQIIYENVHGLAFLLAMVLGDLYHIDVSHCCPHLFGWPISRPRDYFVLRHKAKTLESAHTLDEWTHRWHRTCCFSWLDFFWQTAEHELMHELQWAQRRKTCPNRDDEIKFDMSDSQCFIRGLNNMELGFLAGYKEIVNVDDTAVQLNQDPSDHAMHSKGDSATGALHCIIKNCGVIFTEHPRVFPPRWLTSSETLVAQGFRAKPSTRQVSRVDPASVATSFHLARDRRHPQTMRGQAGNAMHVNCVGVVLLSTFMPRVKPVQSSPGCATPKSGLFANIMLYSQV